MSSDSGSNTGKSDPGPPASMRVPVEIETCANCGRTFSGEYCPSCGQRVESELSVISILGGFVRELIETERGLWRTFKDFTLRPGTATRHYLNGVRRPFTSPGRYLLVGAIVATGSTTILNWVGTPSDGLGRFAISAAQGFTRGSGTAGASGESAWSATLHGLEQLGAVPAVVLLMLAGIAGLLYRPLFRQETDSLAEALAVATYGAAHAAILYSGTELTLELVGHYGKLGARMTTFFEWIPNGVLLLYPGVLTYGCFGPRWWNGMKGALGWTWANVESALVVIMGITGYAEWLHRINPETYTGSGPGAGVAGASAAFLILVHGLLEVYFRYRPLSVVSRWFAQVSKRDS